MRNEVFDQNAPRLVRSTWTVGVLVRGSLRRELLAADIQFVEHKGWLESLFVVHATPYNTGVIADWAKRMGA